MAAVKSSPYFVSLFTTGKSLVVWSYQGEDFLPYYREYFYILLREHQPGIAVQEMVLSSTNTSQS